MSEWLVQLLGEKTDLLAMQQAFAASDPWVVKEEDGFYLKASEFDRLNEPFEVSNLAKQYVKIMNDALILYNPDLKPISLGTTYFSDDNGRKGFVYAKASITLSSLVSGSLSISNDSPRLQEHRAYTIYKVAKTDEEFSEALGYFAKGTWQFLYKAYEVIKDNIGGKEELIKIGWADKNQLSRFTGTAQSKEAIGDEARHGSKKYKPPANPMSISEAKAFIRDLLQKWLETKN